MTLLLLLTSSGGPKYADAVTVCVGDLTGAAESRASLIPFGEINVFAAGAVAPESRTADQPTASVGGVGDLTGNGYQQNQYPSGSIPGAFGSSVLLYLSTAVATALVHEISSFNFLPFDSTVDFSATFPGVAAVDGAPYDSTQHTDGVVPAVSAVVGVAEDRLALQPNANSTAVSGTSAAPYDTTQHTNATVPSISGFAATPYDTTREATAAANAIGDLSGVATDVAALVPAAVVVGVSALGIVVPPRSFAVAANAGGGRVGVGALTDGGGRAGVGSLTSGGGRNTTGTVT